MSIGEFHALSGDAVHAGSGNLRVFVVATQVTLSHIVTQDDNDVRQLFDGRCCLKQRLAGRKTKTGGAVSTGLEKIASFHENLLRMASSCFGQAGPD